MTNANETTKAPARWNFTRELIVTIDRALLARVDAHARAEMDLFICDALHAPAMFGPNTFIVIRLGDFSGFEVRGDMVSAEVDDAAWLEVVRWIRNARAVAALN